MANNKSAAKRDRQRVKRRLANRNTLGTMRTAIKKARAAARDQAPEAEALLKKAVSLIDRAVSKSALPRRTASRYISRLTRFTRSSAQ